MPAVTFPRRTTSTATTITVLDGSLPSWVPGIGEYTTVSTAGTTAQAAPVNGTAFNASFSTWNGAGFNPAGGTYGQMYFFGGGHFSNNLGAVCQFDFGNRAWSLRNPSAVLVTTSQSGDNEDKVNGNALSDGTLVGYEGTDVNGFKVNCEIFPPHTNMACDYCPPEAWPTGCPNGSLGGYVMIHHDNTGVAIYQCYLYLFSLETNRWIRTKVDLAALFGGQGGPYVGSLMAMCYDPSRLGFWCMTTQQARLIFVNMKAQTAALVNINGSSVNTIYCNIVYMPNKDALVFAVPDTFPPGWGTSSTFTRAGGYDENNPPSYTQMPANRRQFYCVKLSGFVQGSTTSLPGAVINYSGTANRWLWAGAIWEFKWPTRPTPQPTDYWQPQWNNYLVVDKMEYCSYDGALWSMDGYLGGQTTGQLYRLLPPSGDVFTQTWQWSQYPVAPKSTSTHQFVWMRNYGAPETSGSDARHYGKFRYIPALKSFAYMDNRPTDYDDGHMQLARPSIFV